MHSLSGLESVAVIVGAIIGAVGFIFTVASLAGGSFRVAKNAKIVADYKTGYDGLKVKADGQEQEIEQLRADIRTKDDRISELEHNYASLQGKMDALQDLVTGRSAIEALTQQLSGLAEAMNNRVGEVLGQVSELRDEVRTAHGQILERIPS